MYYLQSRYYDPETGRFINADDIAFLGADSTPLSYNLFAYCKNNPIILLDPTGNIAITAVILIASIVVGVASAGITAYKTHQAGWETEDVIWYTVGAGLSGFLAVYTLGMSAYQLYTNYCMLNGITPATDISLSSNSQNATSVPQEAWDTLNYVDQHNGSPPQGYKGGSQFCNDGRNGGQVLPSRGAPYREYDIYPYVKGMRGAERIVVGASGSAWYTGDHYSSFIRMRE